MASSKIRTSVIKGLFRELKLSNNRPLKENPVYIYAIDQARKHQITSMKYCRERDELLHVTNTYELLGRYKGTGERSIEESANLVGLGLPNAFEPK